MRRVTSFETHATDDVTLLTENSRLRRLLDDKERDARASSVLFSELLATIGALRAKLELGSEVGPAGSNAELIKIIAARDHEAERSESLKVCRHDF